MRIAHVVPRGEQPWSGILTVIVNLAAALARQGHHVEVFQLHRWHGDGYAEHRQALASAGVAQAPVLGPWWGLGRTVRELVLERGIHVVHLHGAFNPWNTLIARALSRPYVFSPHSGYDPVSLQRSRTRKVVYGWLFERRMLRRAALSVVLTDVELLHLRAFGARRPVEVIPNGVEVQHGPVDSRAFRAELGIAGDTPLAVFVGRLDVRRKGLDILIRGIASVPEWHVALVGPRFREVPTLEAMIERLGVGDRVHLVGERYGRSVHEAFGAGDVFALLSRWEGLPMALLEALSHRTPAVVSPAVERLVGVQASGAGWATDEKGLPAVLAEVVRAGAEERHRRGEAAALLARRYDWASVAERYGAAYERALRSGTIVEP